MLPDLHRRQVEAERLDLPPQVLQLAPGQSRRAARIQRPLQDVQVRQEGRRPVVAAGRARPGRGQPVRRETELAAVRRVRERSPQLARDGGQRLGVAVQRPAERRARTDVVLRDRERPRDPPRGGLQPAQDVIGLDRHRRARDLRRHARVAVAVAADPRVPSQERIERRRPRAAAVRVERAVHLPVDGRERREDRLVEQREHRAHLVQRLGPVRPDRVRTPQPRDLLAHPALDLTLLGDPERPVLLLLEQRADPPQVLHDRAPLRLGGVGGQHGGDPEVAHRRRIHVERRDRVAHRLPRAAPFAQGPDAVPLLGQVDQLEVARERPDHVFGAVQVERRDQIRHAPPAGVRGPAAVRDRGLAERLDLAQERGAPALRDRVPEHGRQHPDVRPERVGQRPLAPARRRDPAIGHAAQPPRTSAWSVRPENVRVEQGGRPLTVERGEHVPHGEVPHGVARVHGGAPQVRDHHHVLEREQPFVDRRLVFEHVETRGEDLPVRERVGERRLVDHRAARRVHQDGRRLHPRERRRVEQMVRLGREVRVDRDEVGLGEQVVELEASGAGLRLDVGRERGRVAVDHAHPEPLRTARDRLSDPSEADDADRLVVHVLAEHHQRPPDPRGPRAEEALALADAPRGGHQQRERGVGRGLGQDVGCVRGQHAGGGARRDIDVVEPHGVVRDDLQLGSGALQELAVDLLGQHRDDRVAPGDDLQQLVARDAELVLVDRDVAPLPQFARGAFHDGPGDQDVRAFAHRFEAPRGGW